MRRKQGGATFCLYEIKGGRMGEGREPWREGLSKLTDVYA